MVWYEANLLNYSLTHTYYTYLLGTGGLFRVLRLNYDEITTISVIMAVKNDVSTTYSMNYVLGVTINDVLYNKYEGKVLHLLIFLITHSLILSKCNK